MALYEIAVFGSPMPGQLEALQASLEEAAAAFKLAWGEDIKLSFRPAAFHPPQRTSAVAIYFGSPGDGGSDITAVLDPTRMTVIPVASTETEVANEVPSDLQFINCHLTDRGGNDRLVATVLECLGLLRKQRRIFLSYRRTEAKMAAIQLFDALSARGYEVFLDTHGVARAVDFQESLWHKLCDVDVMVMLETPTYFESRWTTEEFGRALSKNIGVLRVQWPDLTPSKVTQTSSRVELLAEEIDVKGSLCDEALDRICNQLERFRSLSHAVRRLSIMTQLQAAVESIHGQVRGVGPHFTMHVELPGNRELNISPVLGVPDSSALHDAVTRACGRHSAVLYDHVGVLPSWNDHLSWLGSNIKGAYWIRSSQAAWDLAGWRL